MLILGLGTVYVRIEFLVLYVFCEMFKFDCVYFFIMKMKD